MDEEAIFSTALEKATPAQRDAYLDEACAGQTELRRKVEQLLSAHSRAGDFLDEATAAWNACLPTGDAPAVEQPGTQIGPYKLLEQIGEGGMGLVFMAEQTVPVKRMVALKLVKPGMDSRQVIARFEAERQALALMDHPNIAKVLDAGSSESGRPYFVMELVRGIPITDYCDQARSPIRQRLELFMKVCQAVQHAHTKGIIHRDLKPTNVLVTSHDGVPVPMVIDFGVAKATGQRLTERTLFTHFAQMIGTPTYMSPEQAEMNALDVDTRSDIYSLGVLLYELLTGTTPFDKEKLSNLGYDEMRRIIREDEPPRPSERISTLGAEASSTVSERRGVDARRLGQSLRGELDWVVLKALEKDRTRRYETSSAFAADVQRYLADEHVEACPPSKTYRVRKFVSRNKSPVIAIALVMLAMVAGTIGTSISFVRAEWALSEAKANHVRAEAQRERAETNFRKALSTIEHLLSDFDPVRGPEPASVSEVKQNQARVALRFLNTFCDQASDDPTVRLQQAIAYVHIGRVYQILTRRDKSQQAFRQAIVFYGRMAEDFPEDPNYPRELATALYILADDLHAAGQPEEANGCYTKSTGILRDAIRRHPGDAKLLSLQAFLLCECLDPTLCDPQSAVAPAQKAVALAPHLPKNWLALGIANYRSGKWNDAESALHKALPLASDNFTKAKIFCYRAMAQARGAKQVEAKESLQMAIRIMETNFDARQPTLRAEAATVVGNPEAMKPSKD